MTATGEDTRVDSDLGVDLDGPVACQIFPPPGPCLTPATWVARVPCCGFTAALCKRDKQWALEVIAAKMLTGATIVCELCGAPYIPPTWRPL